MNCRLEKCERSIYSLGLCHRHYMQDYRKKKDNRNLEDIRTWLLSLERERLDTSYKETKQVEKPTFIAPTPIAQKQRDQTMYHAGRYAAGARDKQAIKASIEVNRYIGSN